MINLVTTMSRYLMILLILIYTYYNFRFFSLPDDESKLRLCRLQNVPLFLIFLLSGTIIYLQTEDEAVVLFFGALIYVGLPGTDIILNGNVLSDVPVAVQAAAPVVHTADPQMRDGSVLTVPLQVRLRDASRITAVAGTFDLLRDDTLLYTVTDTVAAGQLTLYWSIRIPDPTESY